MTVGVIGPRMAGPALRDYLTDYLRRLSLDSVPPLISSGHLTRCRASDSPLRRGRVLLAGDAAGLLEPLTREGISFALRSGHLAGQAAARACADPVGWNGHLDAYEADIRGGLDREMAAGRALYSMFARRPVMAHAAVAGTPIGWHIFQRLCRGQTTLARLRRPHLRDPRLSYGRRS